MTKKALGIGGGGGGVIKKASNFLTSGGKIPCFSFFFTFST